MGIRIVRSDVTGAPNQTRIVALPGNGGSFLIVEGIEGTFAYPVLGNGEGPFRSPKDAVRRLVARGQSRDD